MGVAKGLLTGKRGGKNNPMTLLLYPREEMRRRQKIRAGKRPKATNEPTGLREGAAEQAGRVRKEEVG